MLFRADLLCLPVFQIEVAKCGKIFQSPGRSVPSPDAASLEHHGFANGRNISCWWLRKMAPNSTSSLPSQHHPSLHLENSSIVHFPSQAFAGFSRGLIGARRRESARKRTTPHLAIMAGPQEHVAISPTQSSTISADARSPTITSTFSQAETVLTGASDYTTNTGGRARQSWRNSIGNLLRTPSFLSRDQASKKSGGSRRPSPVTTAMTPEIPNESAVPFIPAIELPASPVTGPDEPKSFLDSDSDSDNAPVLSRASSVRVQRPQLVQSKSLASAQSLRVYGTVGRRTSPVPSIRKAQQILGVPATELELGPERQRDNPSELRPGPSISKAEQVLGLSLRTYSELKPATEKFDTLEPVPGSPEAALAILNANATDAASTTGIAPHTPGYTSPSPDSSAAPASIIEVPNTPARREALETLPSPYGGFGTVPMPASHASQNVRMDVSGLSSNPITSADVAALHRALSAPPLPYRRSQHPHRKVTIRPLDLEAAGDYRLRQSVVSTPYPTRDGSVTIPEISPLSGIANRITDALPTTEEEKDRFPSPQRAENLFLELTVENHPGLKTTMKIEVSDRGSFDDESLFCAIRANYRRLLLRPLRSYFTARTLSHVSASEPLFDAVSFAAHLRTPKMGHKRKSWLLWLREQQPVSRADSAVEREKAHISFYSPASSLPRMPFSPRRQPKVTFHYTFSLAKIATAVLSTLVLSCVSAVLWVLFGYPGLMAGHGARKAGSTEFETWQGDAQGRVLTGLVLGVLVALLGIFGSVGWIAGSWVVL